MFKKEILLVFLLFCSSVKFYTHATHGEEAHEIGTLAGDVQNWAMLIQNYILQLANDGIMRDSTQSYLDQATYKQETKEGTDLVKLVNDSLGEYFRKKTAAATALVEKVRELYDEYYERNQSTNVKTLNDLPDDTYYESDIPDKLPKDLVFSPYFRQKVSKLNSTIKIADEVPRDDPYVIDTILFTRKLEETFLRNAAKDPLLRWQYFGSVTGVTRLFPGREWSNNFAGFYDDYDPRVRPWYIQATSGPKDVIIILDCSLSMVGEKFSIAKAVAKTVINTLTKQDYVNVICARNSHWNEVGKWHYYDTTVLSCQEQRMVPATNAHRKDLIEKIDKLKAGGTTELEKGYDRAFDLLRSVPRTGCQSIIVFATDGKDTDGEDVRCGPGYYTRSGYVPGPICKYNFTSVYNVAMEKNKYLLPNARIFSYLIVEDAEMFPGTLACDHNGSLLKLLTGENLITQMSNYFEFLSAMAVTGTTLWTSPYLDSWGLGLMITHAVPVISNKTGKYIGVVGVDATLDEIENFLTKHQWGSVYSFLINSKAGVVFHPRLKPSAKLLEDPIYIPISGLEQDKDGRPSEFSEIEDAMLQGLSGQKVINKARDGKTRTYYYGSIKGTEYSFAFSLASEDMAFRRSQEPVDRSKIGDSYYNLLKMYSSPLLKEKLKGVYDMIDVRENDEKYPGLRVSYKHSTIFLAPQSHCDPIRYSYNDSLEEKTLEAHLWINGHDKDEGCEDDNSGQMFNKGIRADVLITYPIEDIWKKRNFESLDQVKWTNVGLRSGVFRTYPGHRSTRNYDPTQRPWYKRTSSAPHKTSVSTPYMDSAGVGKINTISQAVFEGMTPKEDKDCNITHGKLMGGCPCSVDSDCYIKVCYLSSANPDRRRCATERVEGVTGLDILYDDFQKKSLESMQASDFTKSCGQNYTCRNGEPNCQTRCYLFDSSAYLVMDPDFLTANALDESQYQSVTLGRKEGEVMKHLVYKHKFFIREESIDFQGSCRISAEQPKVTLDGLPQTPEDTDDYYKNRGKIPKFYNDFGCIQDVVSYKTNDSQLGPSGMITGNVSGPCMSGLYYVTALPQTNLYLLVIEDWLVYKQTLFYNFHCKITRSVVNSGAYRIINGTCAHEDTSESTLRDQGRCPLMNDVPLKCQFNSVALLFSDVSLFIAAFILLYTV
ncbi:voltage-dependent calcium channel subunit alpha-2/delta-2-like [Physella acuta]|uniref:voltage-dependent calcium channel subunit alpha-2/delta-2-like n=1 Tax=Physella acuta TaxID=109671 RepID=UPI0027DACED5|nr:voltage-dependent calcium channel subunit alpha-2/delta-2-like [Physella acuta]